MLTLIVWLVHVRAQHEPSLPYLLSCSYRTISQTPTVRNTTKPRTTVMTAESSAAPHSTSPMVGCAQPRGASVSWTRPHAEMDAQSSGPGQHTAGLAAGVNSSCQQQQTMRLLVGGVFRQALQPQDPS